MNKIKQDMINKATKLHDISVEEINNNYYKFVADVKRYNFLWNGIRDTVLGKLYKAKYFKVAPGEILIKIYSDSDLDIFDWKLIDEYGGLEQDHYECQKAICRSGSIWWDLVHNAWHKACEHDWLILENKYKK